MGLGPLMLRALKQARYFEPTPIQAELIPHALEGRDVTGQAKTGTGMTHHFALEVGSEEAQLAWRERLLAAGIRVTPVLDRQYFKSVYFRDPDGHILEIATSGPGFLVDEPKADLGTSLKLPAWLEGDRQQIEARLTPLRVP